MNRTAPRTVAVVPVFDGERLLPACVGALLAGDDDLDVLLVDDGSRDASVAVAERLVAGGKGRVRAVALGVNRGFAAAVNRGVEALGRFDPVPSVVVLVNQDCVVRRGWLAPLLDALGDDAVGVAGARLLDADGITLQHAGARVEANGLTTHVGRGCRDDAGWRQPADCDYVCGALMAFRFGTWLQAGPFDEGYRPAYFEEVDFCQRVRAAGLRVVYVPGCEAVHAEASSSGAGSALFLRRYHRSRLRYVVRTLWPRSGVLAWLRAEAAWIRTLRRPAHAAPVLAAYAGIPRLLAEMALEERKRRTAAAARPR